jgi:beta-galactosidase
MINRRHFLSATSIFALAHPFGRLNAAGGPLGRRWDLPMPMPRAIAPPRPFIDEPTKLLLNGAWRFHLGDIPFPEVKGHGWTYANAKAGNAQGAAAGDFDDSDWPEVDLPHDWAILARPVPDANVSQGYRKRGVGWYRRALRLDPTDDGTYIELQFGAIATNATIWFNGSVVAHNWSGYNSICIDVTALARFGDDLNSIAIRVDADKMEGWWYEGAGLYRDAWLAIRPAAHIATDGVHADPRQDAEGRWTVPVVATLANSGKSLVPVAVEAVLIDRDGREVASGRANTTIVELRAGEARIDLPIAAPTMWTVDDPALYTLRTRLFSGDKPIDERRLRLGFRTIRFDADRGLFLNGAQLKIKGVCLHQDHAGVGVAVPASIWEFRLARLKALGCNAIRFAHNAIATDVLDLCDTMGILVMSENRNFNVSPDYLAQLEWLVRRDRNRPCVVLWSVFNEEPMQGTEAGYEMVRRMVAAVKALDTSRPVTAAMNSGLFAPKNVSQAVDVVGFNYQPDQYDRFHAARPDLPIISSEDTSSFMTRGEYTTDDTRHIKASYDDDASSWGSTHRKAWAEISKRPFVAGTFVWSGFDYHGEPTPYEWPSNSSYFGIMDLCGFPKTAFYLHRAQWQDAAPLLDLVPHWNWAGKEGQPITVMALTNVERVVLQLNGKRVGDIAVDRLVMPRWQVAYAPGRLEAIGYRREREVIRTAIETTGAPVRLRVTPDRLTMAGDGEDAQPFTIDAVDTAGRHVPTANIPVEFDASGGSIVGLGNGNPVSLEAEQGSRHSLFNGLAQVLVRADPGTGTVTLTARAPGLVTGQSSVRRLAAPARASLPPTRPVQTVNGWRQSPASVGKPDPGIAPADTDMNSWLWVNPGELQPAQGNGRWTAMIARFVPYRRVRAQGGRIVLTGVSGRAELWLDGRRVAEKKDYATGPVEAVFPGGDGERRVVVLIESEGSRIGGLSGAVIVGE